MTHMKNLALSLLESTEEAAIAAFTKIGLGQEKLADLCAVEAMRGVLNRLDFNGSVVIGEGERDNAPMLYVDEKLGTGRGEKIDIAVDPLEGTTILATAGAGALSVLAAANYGGFLRAPDVYMEKIAIGFDYSERIIDLDNTPKENLQNIARAKGCSISDLTVTILNRTRHDELIAKVRESGARVKLIQDGDIAAVISTAIGSFGVDAYMGIGGAPEGVLAAAALRGTGGQICGRLLFQDDAQKQRARDLEIFDLTKQYYTTDLASGDDIVFIATGVTRGDLLKGVHSGSTESLLILSKTKEIRYVTKRASVKAL